MDISKVWLFGCTEVVKLFSFIIQRYAIELFFENCFYKSSAIIDNATRKKLTHVTWQPFLPDRLLSIQMNTNGMRVALLDATELDFTIEMDSYQPRSISTLGDNILLLVLLFSIGV